MYKTVKKEVVEIREESIPVCDLCGKETKPHYGGCPSDAPILPLFIGYMDTRNYSYSSMITQQYGLTLGDVCKECIEIWFKDLKERFPNAEIVKIND